ncbi:unnamed protein product [Malus baccata var. baccata]
MVLLVRDAIMSVPDRSLKLLEFDRRRTVSSQLERLWYKIVTISFVVALAMDPLFFYIPIIGQYNKCLGMDKKLWKISLIFRSLTDINALVHLLYRLRLLYKAYRVDLGGTQVVSLLVTVVALFVNPFGIEALALLPILQLLIGVAFYKIWGSGSFQQRMSIINCCLLAQYLPRMYRIREVKKIKKFDIKLKALIYFSLYIFTSHVLGALWYFFSIQREISCWHSSCVNYSTDPKRCMDTFNCDYRTTASRNITFLNQHCSTDISCGVSSVPFNFGIYLDALKTGIVDDVKFSTKLFYCFWWGLRNISNFGTNLVTSTYVWENVFAICISIMSFLLLTFVAGTATAGPQRQHQTRKKTDSSGH